MSPRWALPQALAHSSRGLMVTVMEEMGASEREEEEMGWKVVGEG
jgi:hypothetical protein